MIADRLAERVHAGALGAGARGPDRDHGHPARVAHRLGELRAAAVTAGGARRPARATSTTRPRPAAATRTTGGSAPGWARPAGRCTSTRCPAPGRTPTRPTGPRWPGCSPPLPDDAVVLVDGLIASAVPDAAGAARRAGCAWSSWCTCRSARRRAEAPRRWPPPRRRRHHQRLDPPAPARARTRCSPTGSGRRAPGVRPGAAARPARRPATGCSASRRSPRTRGTTCWSTRWPRSPTGPGRCVCVGTLDRDPDFVAPAARPARPARGLAERVRLVGPLTGAALDAAYAAADLLVLPSRGETYGMVVTEALARGAAGAGHRRRRAARGARSRARTASRPGCWSRPATRRRWPPRCAAGWTTTELRARLRRAARARRDTLTDWPVTTASAGRRAEGGGGMTAEETLPFADWLRLAGAGRRGGPRRRTCWTPSGPD